MLSIDKEQDLSSQNDSLKAALRLLNEKKIRNRKGRYVFMWIFYLLSALSAFVDGFVHYQDFGISFRVVVLFAGAFISLLIPIIGQLTKSQKFVNYATFVFVILFDYLRFLSGVTGIFGYIGQVFKIIVMFGFMDFWYAAAASFGKLFLITANYMFFIPLPYPEYDKYVFTRYLMGMFLMTSVGLWFEYKIHQIASYRDSSLQIALVYCEQLEEARQEAIEANRAKSKFLSSVSHDIRTPLNAIVGYSEIIQTRVKKGENVDDYIEKIISSEKYLEDIIDDILNMSRIETGKETVYTDTIRLDQFCQGVNALISPLAKDKAIRLDRYTGSFKHRIVQTDSVKLRRIMVNILSNAIKYTPEGGHVECSFYEEECTRENYGTFVFMVKDNGIGMSKEFLSQIYEPFAREETSSTRYITGTGLGMAIVKKYVDLLGGTIAIDSAVGVGTTVTVRMDLLLGTQADLNESEQLDHSFLIGKHILYVDDNRLNREVARMMLEDLQMHVDLAENGQQAVDHLEQSDVIYDYVLMDVRMPVLNGLEATKLIRASRRAYLKSLPIIAVTANALEEDCMPCLQAGMNDYISKPFSEEDLIEKMYKCTEDTGVKQE